MREVRVSTGQFRSSWWREWIRLASKAHSRPRKVKSVSTPAKARRFSRRLLETVLMGRSSIDESMAPPSMRCIAW